MATDIPRIHKWWQQPSPNNDYRPPFAPTLTLEKKAKNKSKKKKTQMVGQADRNEVNN